MKKENLRIVYMGTPDFAVESLKRLVEKGYNIVGVITMPDKPAGRGHKIQFSPVKQYALSQNLPLLQPEKLKDENFLKALREWNADLQIVVAFRMLPEVVWNMPRLGTFNLHASLLPQYRGAAPINWAIINGDTMTGVTTFFLSHAIDTGRIIMQRTLPITSEDNAGTIHDKLMFLVLTWLQIQSMKSWRGIYPASNKTASNQKNCCDRLLKFSKKIAVSIGTDRPDIYTISFEAFLLIPPLGANGKTTRISTLP